MDFVALDFETANPRLSSICQIGATRFRGGEPVETLCTYVEPQDYFHPMNVSVHGICEATVIGAPTFAQAHGDLHELIGDAIVVTHTGFDRTALHRACEMHALPPALCRWLDSSMTKHTTLLVVGDQDLERLADGETKSSKHRKAESLIQSGQPLRILSEADFQALIDIKLSA